jgi:hypothetical protein
VFAGPLILAQYRCIATDQRKPLSELRLPDLDGDGNATGNVDQQQRIRDYGRRIGWKVTRVIVENDRRSPTARCAGCRRSGAARFCCQRAARSGARSGPGAITTANGLVGP